MLINIKWIIFAAVTLGVMAASGDKRVSRISFGVALLVVVFLVSCGIAKKIHQKIHRK